MKLPEYELESRSSIGYDPSRAMEYSSPISYDPTEAEETSSYDPSEAKEGYDPPEAEEEEKKVAELLNKVEMMQTEVDTDEDDPKAKYLTNIIDECLKKMKKVGRPLEKMDNNISRQKRQRRDGQN
ncbi:hypothetical protein TorRG33x02_103890 [Trema orientale]|uniref:Uncharacterized protein n=1 Tax=Trema orientale TaxID=63057 RepID=A0A2P5F7F2_TREOI|nr:hypothetical protein TorRG33x02_103890 [Trema orientale]